MKTFILFSLLLTLVACKSESSDKKCSFNGEPVPCSEGTNSAVEDDGEGRDTSPETSSIVVTAKVTTAIRVSPYEIEILENTEDIQERTVNGNSYSCETSTTIGSAATYKISDGKLVLLYQVETDEGPVTELETLVRSEGSGNKLDGVWKSGKDYDEKGYMVSTYTFKGNTMKEVVECHFY